VTCLGRVPAMAKPTLSGSVTRTILKELVGLTTQKPCEGIRVTFSEDNICEVLADIDGPTGTPYEGGVFRAKLILGPDFPHAPPKGWFLTKVFHPNVSEAGEICVNVLKKDWKPELGIRHVLLVGAAPPLLSPVLQRSCSVGADILPSISECTLS
jgi:ubiquitin-conjugating enzyme E2 S